MYKTFNCGIGFILSSPKSKKEDIISTLEDSGFIADEIGKVVKGSGKVNIESMFSHKAVSF